MWFGIQSNQYHPELCFLSFFLRIAANKKKKKSMLKGGRKTDEYVSAVNKNSCLGLKLSNLQNKNPETTAVFTPSHKDKSQSTGESTGPLVLPHLNPLF